MIFISISSQHPPPLTSLLTSADSSSLWSWSHSFSCLFELFNSLTFLLFWRSFRYLICPIFLPSTTLIVSRAKPIFHVVFFPLLWRMSGTWNMAWFLPGLVCDLWFWMGSEPRLNPFAQWHQLCALAQEHFLRTGDIGRRICVLPSRWLFSSHWIPLCLNTQCIKRSCQRIELTWIWPLTATSLT